MKNKFDLIVIGAGSAGTSVARSCAAEGWKVGIVEELKYGGTCMLRGCDPKKMFLAVTEGIDAIERMSDKGLTTIEPTVNWKKMSEFKNSFIEPMPERVENSLKRLGIEEFHGKARFNDDGSLQVGDDVLESEYFHIATGASPIQLGIEGEEHVKTSTDFLDLNNTPERIVFIGGGFISFEFAQISKRGGADQVTILQRGEKVLNQFDADLVDMQVEKSREMGIDIQLNSVIQKIEKKEHEYTITYNSPNGLSHVVCDLIIHGAGRGANIQDLNLEAINVATTRKGVVVNEFQRSISNPKVFSAGDAADTSKPNLTPVAGIEAKIVAKNLIAKEDKYKTTYPAIPSVVYTLPPIAKVGLTEKDVEQRKDEVKVKFKKTHQWYSSVRVNEKYSAFKTIVDKKTNKILGAHLLGPGAEEQVNVITMAINQGLTVEELKAIVFAYPSYSSDIKYMFD
ncbi:FAD-dependent oxidoreductase [Flammeovirga yaeyamensis]|uniref:FAD-dependent oxidoreductase n=1 Tax=Flammeovirga yaeyamensis TaxID=367791 RepID=A0AAX1NFB3_9BACT|nr:NAD(P)/FAD-dependent oxidoreductase [Flammeovirga yaeyamensis]MBB3696739.1 glutathione reductase (NADPH) [Flammeovirga yaeyamensis]NMF33409.1 NAD(P)/FAD-dependent oxidoreductase [Flammeovirga yaeyamensis]QWG05317.1 FAD-dependent oxidoreductase [Flammeovirga yaeyamensis]